MEGKQYPIDDIIRYSKAMKQTGVLAITMEGFGQMMDKFVPKSPPIIADYDFRNPKFDGEEENQ